MLLFLVTISARLLVSDKPNESKVLATEKGREVKVVAKPVPKGEKIRDAPADKEVKLVAKPKEKKPEAPTNRAPKPGKVVSEDNAKPEEVTVLSSEKSGEEKSSEEAVVDETMADSTAEKEEDKVKVVVPETTEGLDEHTKTTLASFYSSLVAKNKKQVPGPDADLYKKDWGTEWGNGNHPSWKGKDFDVPVVTPKKEGSAAFWWLWAIVITLVIGAGISVWYSATHA